MRTIQEYLKECDRESIIHVFIHQYAFSPLEMMDKNCREITLGQIMDYYEENLNKLIDRLINTTPVQSEDRWILLAHHCASEESGDMVYNLYKEDELKTEGPLVSYSYEFAPFEEVVGFYVADTYLTQYKINGLIVDFLNEVSWTGFEHEKLDGIVDEIIEGAEEAEAHKDDPSYFITLDELKNHMEEKFGLKHEEEDPRQEEARLRLSEHQIEYNDICQKIEIEKLKESIRKEKEC